MLIQLNDDPPFEMDDDLFERVKKKAEELGLTLDQMFEKTLIDFLKGSTVTVKRYEEMLGDEENLPFDRVLIITDDDGKALAVQIPYGEWNDGESENETKNDGD